MQIRITAIGNGKPVYLSFLHRGDFFLLPDEDELYLFLGYLNDTAYSISVKSMSTGHIGPMFFETSVIPVNVTTVKE